MGIDRRRIFGTVFAALAAFFVLQIAASAAETVLLWPNGAPGAKGGESDFKPTLTIYKAPAESNTGAAVVICPGGGYGGTAMGHEGHAIAQWLNTFGVSGIILDYRHRGRGYKHPAPLQDAQRAIRTVRAKAEELGIKPDRIGIMGFSAGGHLASTAGTHFDAGAPESADPIDRVSCRPDFMILCYAVIALGEPYTHYGSQRNLLGEDASDDLIRQFSNEKQVTAQTPPTFLWHTDEDRGVPSENSIYFYLACRKNNVPAELHVFRKGNHGVGLGASISGTSNWPMLCEKWLGNMGVLAK